MRASLKILAGKLLAGLCLASGGAAADNAPPPDIFAIYANPQSVVLAVRAEFAPVGGAIRLAAYSRTNYLEKAETKGAGVIDANGVAIVPLPDLPAGDYAFVAYYDRNGDGKLNRDPLGKPKEPFGFSNGVRPKLRKPRFDEARVNATPGDVIVVTLKD